MNENPTTPRNWWGVGLAMAFLSMLVVNGVIIWFAVSNSDTIVSSYAMEGR